MSQQKLAPITYGLLTLVPIVAIAISFFTDSGFLVQKIVTLVFLLLVSAYSGAISRKGNCARCKMRFVCPGSAAR